MGWPSQGALTLPPAPPHPAATLSWGCYLNGPLCHSKRVSAASCALLHALTLRLMSERCGFRWHRCRPRARLGRDHARRLSALVQARRSRRGNHGGNTRLRRLRSKGRPRVTDILTNDEISLLRSLEKKSRTITGNFTHKRYDRLETKGYIKRSSQFPSMQDMLYEITDAGKAALRAAGGAAG